MKGDLILLQPGTDSWEIWRGQPGQQAQLVEITKARLAAEVRPPGGCELCVAFPVSASLVVPFLAETNDEALFADLAALHLEKNAIKPEVGGGVLTDVFVAKKSETAALLVPAVLSAPQEGELPNKSPKHCDLSVRMFEIENQTIAIWREFGRWALGIGGEQNFVFSQILIAEKFDTIAARELKLTLHQLAFQGCIPSIARARIWIKNRDRAEFVSEFFPDGEAEFARILGFPVELAEQPAPRIPEQTAWSNLLPADVHANRKSRAKRRQIRLAIAAIVLLYLGIAYYFVMKWNKQSRDIAALKTEIERLLPTVQAQQSLRADWAELGPVVDSSEWPEDILLQCASALPSDKKVRFKVFDVSPDPVTSLPSLITIQGEGKDLDSVSQMSTKLKNVPSLKKKFVGELPPAENTSDNLWKFSFTANRLPPEPEKAPAAQ